MTDETQVENGLKRSAEGACAPERVIRALRLLVMLASAAYGLAYLYIAVSRIGYPLDLEWLENGMAHEVQRVLQGEPLYVPPSVEYGPFIYPPLYVYLCAAVCKLTGGTVTFTPLRAVSFLASLGCFLMIFLLVRRYVRSAFAGIAAVGFYAAAFRICGAWYDTARVDSVLLFALLVAIFLMDTERSLLAHAAAGLVLLLAVLTKQSALMVAAPLLCGSAIVRVRRALLTGGILAAGLLLSIWALDRLNNGWFTYYILNMPASHRFRAGMWTGFWTKDIIGAAPILAVLAASGLALQGVSVSARRFATLGAATCGMFAISWLTRVHEASYVNVLMPAFAWMAILAGIVLGTVPVLPDRIGVPRRRCAEIALCALCLVQFALLRYPVRAQIPTEADRQAGERLLALIAQTEGDVFMPYHNFLPALVGKKVFTGNAGFASLLDGRAGVLGNALARDLHHAIARKHFALIVLDADNYYLAEVHSYYQQRPSPFTSEDVLWPVTGMRTRPCLFYVPTP